MFQISVHGQPPVQVNYPNTEICTLLGRYAAQSANSLPTLRDNLSVSSSRAKNPRKDSVASFILNRLRRNPQELRSHLHRDASLKSCVSPFLQATCASGVIDTPVTELCTPGCACNCSSPLKMSVLVSWEPTNTVTYTGWKYKQIQTSAHCNKDTFSH